MSTKEKLVRRFCQLPKDFTFEELIRLMHFFGFELDNKGSSSGSRVAFVRNDMTLDMHRPHPGNIIKPKTLKYIYDYLHGKALL
ncbi:MAG: type II toxin-antitoxin system HicA family toxin [Bacteroidales bacterium]|nr:type II toxin-antitoxin system HicA family toxin [Bacteroidales bacterium]